MENQSYIILNTSLILILFLIVFATANTPPPLVYVVLNSTVEYNSTVEDLTCWTDQDDNASVKLIYNWSVDDVPITVLNMPFEGGSNSTWTRDYALGHDGIVYGATYNQTAGYDGWGAYEFDGINDGINISHHSDLNLPDDFSVEVWAKINAAPSPHSTFIVGKTSEAAEARYNYNLVVLHEDKAGRVRTSLFDGQHWCAVTTDPSMADGKWHHYVAVRNRATDKLYLYVDGVLNGSTTDTMTQSILNNEPIRIGSRTTFSNLNGSVDEVRIYKRALSAQQILALYENKTKFIESQETREGDVWKSCVTPNDGSDGSTTCSNTLTIRPPPLVYVVLNSTSGCDETTDNLTVHTKQDDEPAVKLIRNWFVNNNSLAILNMPFEAWQGQETVNTKDYSGFGNHGTIHGTTFSSIIGYDGFGAYSYDGNDYIGVDHTEIETLSSGSISVWVNGSSANLGQILVMGDTDAQSYFLFGNDATKYGVRYQKANIDQIQGRVQVLVSDALWHHYVFTVNASGNKIYIDGVQETITYTTGSAASTFFFSDNAANWDNLQIGRRNSHSAPGGYWKGDIDDLVVWNKTLTPEQVKALYENRTDLIVSQETTTTETWKSCVTVNDRVGDGIEGCSNTLTIGVACNYTTGNWIVPCGCNCNISSNVDVLGNNILISGAGTFTTYANITN